MPLIGLPDRHSTESLLQPSLLALLARAVATLLAATALAALALVSLWTRPVPGLTHTPSGWGWEEPQNLVGWLLVPAQQSAAWQRAVHDYEKQTGTKLPIRLITRGNGYPSASRGPVTPPWSAREDVQRERWVASIEVTDPVAPATPRQRLPGSRPWEGCVGTSRSDALAVPLLVEPYLLLSEFPGPPLPVDLTLPVAQDLAARLGRGEPSPIPGVRLGQLSDRRAGWQAWRVDGVWPGVFSVARGEYPLGRTVWLRFGAQSIWAADPRLRAFVAWLQTAAGRTSWLGLPAEMRLAAVGDLMFDRGVRRQMEIQGGDYPLARVAPQLARYDLTVGNLESSFGERDRGQPVPGKGIWFLASPSSVRLLVQAGFDAVSVANNHALDFGVEPFRQNLETLRQAGIGVFGGGHDLADARAPWLSPARPFRVAFLGYSPFADTYWSTHTRWSFAATAARPGIAPPPSPAALAHDIAQARKAGAQFVMVYYHWGAEYAAVPTTAVRRLARATIDAGADVVLGSHPHVLQGVEWVEGRPVAYSLGNFVMDQPWPLTQESMILEIDLGADGVRGVSPLPVQLDSSQPGIPKDLQALRNAQARLHYLNLLLTLNPPLPATPQPR